MPFGCAACEPHTVPQKSANTLINTTANFLLSSPTNLSRHSHRAYPVVHHFVDKILCQTPIRFAALLASSDYSDLYDLHLVKLYVATVYKPRLIITEVP